MKRTDLAHILRAAAEIAGDNEMLIIGSQAILGFVLESDLPDQATMSMEADVAFLDDVSEEKSDLVDGAIGEGSLFHQKYGYYAQGVGINTATLPEGWEERASVFSHGDPGTAKALCPEPHDLVVSKLVAGREKDIGYARSLVVAGIVDCATLRERTELLSVPPAQARRVLSIIKRFEAMS